MHFNGIVLPKMFRLLFISSRRISTSITVNFVLRKEKFEVNTESDVNCSILNPMMDWNNVYTIPNYELHLNFWIIHKL